MRLQLKFLSPFSFYLKILVLIFQIQNVFFFSETFAQSWVSINDFPGTGRDDGICFLLNNKAYCGTGLSSWFSDLGDVFALDLNTEIWTQVSSLPPGKERQYACGFSNAQFGYVFGGITGNSFLNDLWKYEPAGNSWQTASSLPMEGRMGSSVFVIGDTAYIMGGKTASQNSSSEFLAYCFSTDTWVNKGHLPFGGRWRASACTNNGLGYLIFGKDSLDHLRNELFSFNPINNTWTLLGNFPLNARIYSTLQSGMGELWLMAGIDSIQNLSADLWKYDIANNTWQTGVNLPANGRKGGMGFYHNNRLFYSCGIDENNLRLKETWKLDLPMNIDESFFEVNPSVFPNPFDREIFVNLSLQENNPINLLMHDVHGHLILEKKLEIPQKIATENLSPGIYFLTLQKGKAVHKQKLVKISSENN